MIVASHALELIRAIKARIISDFTPIKKQATRVDAVVSKAGFFDLRRNFTGLPRVGVHSLGGPLQKNPGSNKIEYGFTILVGVEMRSDDDDVVLGTNKQPGLLEMQRDLISLFDDYTFDSEKPTVCVTITDVTRIGDTGDCPRENKKYVGYTDVDIRILEIQ